jgi:hypothetical protein
MDPNLFHIDLERLFEVLMAIVVLSFFVERALSLLFGHRWWVALEERKVKGLKEPIAVGVAIAACYYWHFDAVSILLVRDETGSFGYWITGAVIAGGSKASIRLFWDLMDIKTQAEKDYLAKRNEEKAAQKAAGGNPAPPVAPPAAPQQPPASVQPQAAGSTPPSPS